MRIIEPSARALSSGSFQMQRYETVGGIDLDQTPLLCEHRMEVWIHGSLWLTISCTPADLTELVIGRLITEGAIRCKEDVALLAFNEDGTAAKVQLRHTYLSTDQAAATPACHSDSFADSGNSAADQAIVAPLQRHTSFADSGNSAAGQTASSDESPCGCGTLHHMQPIPWEPSWIVAMADYLESKTPLYAQTHSAHSALLLQEGTILCCFEDIARHNAIDKVVGWSEREGINRSSCVLFTSGRIPVDMAIKAIRAGIPVLASKALPMQQSVPLAKHHGMTLLHISKRLGLLRFA